MRLLYICGKDTHRIHSSLMANSHYIDLPNGEILVAAQFSDDHLEGRFSEHPAVQPLPHPFSGEPVGDAIATKLGHLGVTKDHNHYQVAQLAGKIHPLMKMRAV